MAYHYTATFDFTDLDRDGIADLSDQLGSMSPIPTVISDECALIEFDGRYGEAKKRRYLDRICRKLDYIVERVEEIPDEVSFSHRRES